MKTRNQFRNEKIKEILKVWNMYPDLATHERYLKILEDLKKKAERTGDYTQLPSVNEMAAIYPLFINPKTGRPATDAMNLVRRLGSRVRKDKGHPHILPYTEPHTEIDVRGEEVLRHYLNILRGNRAIVEINLRLEKQKTGITETQKANKEAASIKKVDKEFEEYMEYLEQKQRAANDKKRKKRYL